MQVSFTLNRFAKWALIGLLMASVGLLIVSIVGTTGPMIPCLLGVLLLVAGVAMSLISLFRAMAVDLENYKGK